MKSYVNLMRPFLCALLVANKASSFTLVPSCSTRWARDSIVTLGMENWADNSVSGAEVDLSYEPYFETFQLPIATTSSRLERFVECAEDTGECDVTEMQEMIEGE